MRGSWKKKLSLKSPIAGPVSGTIVWLASLLLEGAVTKLLGQSIFEWISDHPLTVILSFSYMWLIIAYYKRLGEIREENEAIKAGIERSRAVNARDTDGSVSLLDAIKYIQEETEYGKQKIYEDVFKEIKRLAAGDALKIRAREKRPYLEHVDKYESTVPADIIKSCEYVNYGEFRKLALVGTKEQKEPKRNDLASLVSGLSQPLKYLYYEPTVMMKDIKHHFGDPLS